MPEDILKAALKSVRSDKQRRNGAHPWEQYGGSLFPAKRRAHRRKSISTAGPTFLSGSTSSDGLLKIVCIAPELPERMNDEKIKDRDLVHRHTAADYETARRPLRLARPR
jgi:N-acetylglucosamine-6-phosphate deacetylase